MTYPTICPVCGGTSFNQSAVLDPELIAQWELQPHEVDYISEQQGFACTKCDANLRAMTLAQSILTAFDFDGLFCDWVEDRALAVLEINRAQMLTPFTSVIRGHVLAEYPVIDMQRLPYPDGSFDLVMHSDTLEHVTDSVAALRECRRVLKPGGCLAYTAPIIVGRLSRSREGMAASYHGGTGANATDYLVHTEFGADFWDYLFRAGFDHVEMLSYRYPAGIAILASQDRRPGALTSRSTQRSWFRSLRTKLLNAFGAPARRMRAEFKARP
jgi:SAM-dependent methyltransferase